MRVSQDIAIFTDSEEVPLSNVFKNIFEHEDGGKSIDHKSTNEELKKYMAVILPNYDKERVYMSDIKKVVRWYNILHENNLLSFEEEKTEEPSEEEKTDGVKSTSEKKTSEKKEKEVTAEKQVKQEQSSVTEKPSTEKESGKENENK